MRYQHQQTANRGHGYNGGFQKRERSQMGQPGAEPGTDHQAEKCL